VAFFGSEGLFCFDLDGKLLWSKSLGRMNVGRYGIGYGYGSSPVLHQDRIVLLCDDPHTPFVTSLRLADGKELWRVSRQGDCERSWGTPLIHSDGTRTQVVTNGWPFIVSYDLETGKEFWRLSSGGDVPIPSPFVADGWIVVTNSHGGKSPIYTIRPSAKGNITLPDGTSGSDSIVWSNMNGGSYISTPVVYGGYLYLAHRNGVLRCYEYKTGRKMFEERLDVGTAFSASLVAADGKIYCPAEEGVVYVIKSGPTLEVLAKNQMGEPCLATPAISQGIVYFRTVGRLIAVA
jgi:outer membrane protein assembly factor BamB